jgi:glycosyltransferase involved in cell wall biosynthesis
VRTYDGPHRITLNRNPQNLGIGAHVNRIMELVSSDIIVIAAGDDMSHPDRVSKIMAAFSANPNCYLVHSGLRLMDQHGAITGKLQPATGMKSTPQLVDMAANNLSIIGATGAWRREVFDVFGPLHEKVINEDIIIPFRAVMLGDISYVTEDLVDWRKVGVSSDFHSKCGHDVLFGKWVDWQLIWRDAYRDRISDLHKFYQNKIPENVLSVCEREMMRYDSIIKLSKVKNTIRRLPTVLKVLTTRSLPLGWRIKTSLMYSMPKIYAAFFDWKMRRGMIG